MFYWYEIKIFKSQRKQASASYTINFSFCLNVSFMSWCYYDYVDFFLNENFPIREGLFIFKQFLVVQRLY